MTAVVQIFVFSIFWVYVYGDIADQTCFSSQPVRSLDASSANAFIGSYIDDIENPRTTVTITFGRVLNTGGGDDFETAGAPVYKVFLDDRYFFKQTLSTAIGSHRVGAFFCNLEQLNQQPSYIPTIILASGAYSKPERQTQTVSFGESVTIKINLNGGDASDVRWRLNGVAIESWSGLLNVSIASVTDSDEGFYECYLDGRREEGKHAIMRLIVRGCSASRWGMDCQNQCPTCYNGGVCDDVSGFCVCPPGFKGDDCSEGCGNNNWGKFCASLCSSNNPGCSGNLACVPDPFGCSCMAGYKGLNCKKGCDPGHYGSTCSEECHCATDTTCDVSIGCPDGPCAVGYSGINCQVPDTCPEGHYGELCKYECHCEDDGACDKDTGSCGERRCRDLWIGSDCQLDGRTKVDLQLPSSNRGALVTITCIVQANPIPEPEDIRVLDQNDTIFDIGMSVVSQDSYTRIVVYSNVSVAEGDVYKCQVLPNVAGVSNVSKRVVIYDAPVLLTPPTVTASGSTVTVTWNQWMDTTDEGDGPVIGYYACYQRIGHIILTCNSMVEHTTDTFDIGTDLQRGIEYEFEVRVVRPGSKGIGASSPVIQFTVPCLSPEVVPPDVTIGTGTNYITVQWQLIDSNHWRCNSLSSYTVQYRRVDIGSLQMLTVSGTDTTATINDLTPCTAYYIQVTANNTAGEGPAHSIDSVRTDTEEPGDLTVNNITASPTSLMVKWDVTGHPECITLFNIDYALINLDQCNTSVTETGNKQFPTNSVEGMLTDLRSNSLYRLQVSAVFGDEATQPTEIDATTSTTQPNGKPLDISIVSSDETELSFTWLPPRCGERNGPITGYKARLKKYPDGENDSETVPNSVVVFSSLTPCTNYTFQVRAYSQDGDIKGPWSEEFTATTAAQVPEVVQNVNVNGGNRSILVTWEPPFTEDCHVDFYKLEYQLKSLGLCGDPGESSIVEHTSDTRFEIHNLEVYSSYQITVSAIVQQMGSADNLEGQTTTVTATTAEGEPLAGPGHILGVIRQEATNEDLGSVSINFSPVPCLQRRGEITHYNVQVINAEGELAGSSSQVSEIPITITGLQPCQSGIPQVAACTLVGCGEFASGPSITMNLAAPGEVSVNVQTQPQSRKLLLVWSAPVVAPCPIVQYMIKYKPTQIDGCQEVDVEYEVMYVDGTTTTDTLKELIPFSVYNVIVSAVVRMNGNTLSTPGRTGYNYTNNKDPTASPINIIYNNSMSARSLKFSWQGIPCGDRKGIITEYEYMLKTVNTKTVRGRVNLMFVELSDLVPCTAYNFTVRGRGPGGQGPYSDAIQVTTISEVPGRVEHHSIQRHTILGWDRPPPFTCEIVNYHIQANLTSRDMCLPSNNISSFTVEDAEFQLLRLEPFSRYFITIRAETAAGIGPPYTFTISTPNQAPAQGPKELFNTRVSATEASFAWTEIECGYRRGVINGYRYSIRTKDSGEVIDNGTVTVRECTVTRLKPFTAYIFSVKGFNSVGDSDSTELHITTNESTPTVPRNIEILNSDTESFLIQWARPEPANGIVIGYLINYTVANMDTPAMLLQYNVSDGERSTIDFTYTVENLQANTNYTVQIAAFTLVGIGPWSEHVRVSTYTGIPGHVHNLNVLEIHQTNATVTWEEPLNPNGVITNYYVDYRLVEKVFEPDADILVQWHTKVVKGNVYRRLLKTLEPASWYDVKMCAETSAGKGKYMNVTFKTPTPPVTIQPTFSVISQTDTTVTVNLKPLQDYVYVRDYVMLVEVKTGAKRRDVHETLIHENSPDKYITASFPRDDVPAEFTVGDGKTYNGYRNPPLDKEKSHSLTFLIDSGEGELQMNGAEPRTIQLGLGFPVGLFVGLLFGCIFTILVISMVITLKRRRGFRGRPMFPMSPISKENNIPPVPSDDADTTNNANPPIESKAEDVKAARVHRPVKIEQLAAYVKKKRMNQEEGFQNDFDSLPDQQMYSWDVAKKSENKTKNRYGNIVAYDHCRVVLDVLPGDPHSDYINACYIDGYKQKNAYIATQGPNTASVQDIWRMVWQESCSVIVMITNLSEGGKKKCEKYWPEKSQTYGDIDVKTMSEDDYVQYTIRTFRITKGNEDYREVKQFHFTVWPDMGVPEFASDVLKFISVVKENGHSQTGPTIVHCSAGVGRTGTLIAISEMLDMARDEGRINVFTFVHQMRSHRVKMVQTSDQYFFIFDALLEAVVCGQTSTKAADMNSFYSSLLNSNSLTRRSYILEQYNALEAMNVVTTDENSNGGKLPANAAKNRFPTQIPIDGSRPYLMTLSSEDSTNYINATFLHGYRGKDMYISTQMPMPNTVADFWCMVYDYKSMLIIMLNDDPDTDKTYGKYWPESGSVQHGPMTIEYVSTEESKAAICRTFKLRNTAATKEEPRQIKQYQYIGWPSTSKTPACEESVLEFLKLLDREDYDRTGVPITVHCKNGMERCGLFCTIHSVLQRLQQEQVVDVFHTIRKLRRSKANMVSPVSQYEFCFKTIQCYLDAFEIYSNYR